MVWSGKYFSNQNTESSSVRLKMENELKVSFWFYILTLYLLPLWHKQQTRMIWKSEKFNKQKKKARRRNNTYQRNVNRKKLSLLNFYWSDTLWLHLPYYEISIFFHFLVILSVQFFKYWGWGRSKKMKSQNKNERMKKVRRIKQKTALPAQRPLAILTFTATRGRWSN